MTILARCWLLFFALVGQETTRPLTRPLKLTSPAIGTDQTLPAEFTCDGERVSPPLAWGDAPMGTRAFAVTMHHFPQYGTKEDRHAYLVLYNLPASVTGLEKGHKSPGSWGINTVNDEPEYAPPCSRGPGRRAYVFTVYALSEPVVVGGKRTMKDLEEAMAGKVLGTAVLEVSYARPEVPAPTSRR